MVKLPEGAERDFTASCFVVREDEEILLVEHSKLGMWLQPGGHVEEGELPHETALRETREETGWRVEILEEFVPEESYSEKAVDLSRPFNINLHRIEEGHWHCDMQFVARPIEKVEATHEHEHDGQEWFSTTEIDDLDAPENLRAAAMKALELTT